MIVHPIGMMLANAAGVSFVDTFEQANGTILQDTANYAELHNFGTNRINVQSGQAIGTEAPTGSGSMILYDGAALANGQYAEVVIGTPIAAASLLGVILLRATSISSYYSCNIAKNYVRVDRTSPGNNGTLGTTYHTEWPTTGNLVAGERVRFEVSGTTLTVKIRDGIAASFTDSFVTSGKAGFQIGLDQSFTEFACGDL